MCGLSGYAGISPDKRVKLIEVLGEGIDDRGGHAAGYVSLTGNVSYARRIGRWEDSRSRFIRGAAQGAVCMMHARFATCGDRDDVVQAHPFAIQREGGTVLWGAHNGMIHNARASAL